MRTTLNIDDEALAAVKSLSKQRQRSIGTIVSELILQALSKQRSGKSRSGVPLLPSKAKASPVTMELINSLRDGDT